MRALLTILPLLAMLAAPPASAAQGAAEREAAQLWRATCKHYVNRARYKPRDTGVEFVTVLADGCAAAMAEIAAGADVSQEAAAARFLDRLAGARLLIAEMNSARIAAARTQRAREAEAFTRLFQDIATRFRLVSPNGEYLILRAEGVFEALGAWVEAGADFELIAALPD